MMETLTKLRIAYGSLWVVSIAFAFLYENGIVEDGAYADSPTVCYALGTLGVALTIVLIPFSLKVFSRIFNRISQLSDDEAKRLQVRYESVRIALYYVIVLLNISIYYATLQSSSALCALMALVAYLFCVPKKMKNDGEA